MDEAPDAPDAPDFLNEIPEAVFGKVIKSRTFREALFAEHANVRQVLDEAGIYISRDGVRQLEDLIALEQNASTLRPLDDGPQLV
ncbi:MAG TPA: hypothetical protein VHM94_12860 [Acidimicrobiia bacterium]|jgi:hypothetical protein|nr:hypothetical protein [Acidimicrobiia bacterium]